MDNPLDNLFGFLKDLKNYSSRLVLTYRAPGLVVDTARVSDGDHPYETAVAHPDYDQGKLIIVEAYDTEADARAGQARWVKIMSTAPLPEELEDCANSAVAQLLRAAGDRLVFPRKPK